jgi:hypothetical protein
MKRILAIDPITRGFGFAVLDGPHCLIDWGLKGTSRWQEPRERWCLRQIAELIDVYRPDRVVVEDCFDRRSRRVQTSRRLIERICNVARLHGVSARRISRAGVHRAFPPERACTKYKIALAIAGRFPELAWRLPPIRKPWMSEDTRMGIFDAVALALAFYAQHRAPQSGSSEAVTVSPLNGGEITPSTMRRR